MTTVIHQTFMNEETRRARYVLIDLSIFEEVIDLIGKCPAENCRGKVKIQTIFQKKKKIWDCLAATLRYVIKKAIFSPAKKFETLKLMILTYIQSLLFVKMEKYMNKNAYLPQTIIVY